MAEGGVQEGQKQSLRCTVKKPLENEGLDVSNHTHRGPGTFVATGEMELQPRKITLARGPLPGRLWVWARGTHDLRDSVRFLCACTQRTHLLGEQGLHLLSALCVHPRPQLCVVRQGEGWYARLGINQLFP